MLRHFLIREIKENFGLALYNKPQKFQVTIDLKVSNKSSKRNKIVTIIPLPYNDKNQKLVGRINFSPKTFTTEEDKKFQNKYARFEETLKPKDVNKYSVKYSINIYPQKLETSSFSLKDHRKDLDINHYTENEKYIESSSRNVNEFFKKNKIDESNVLKIANHWNQVVIKKLKYGNPILGLYSADESLIRDNVDCGGFSSLLTALLRLNGISARLVLGFLLSKKGTIMHAWVECMLPDKTWMPLDPTIENLLKTRGTKRSGKLGFVGSDHLRLSIGSDIEIKGLNITTSLDILQNPLIFSQYPVEKTITIKSTNE